MNKATVKKQQIIQHITQHLIQNGLSDIGLRTLATAAGTSDRMLIYYFETKDNLIGEALNSTATNLAAQLDAVLGEHQRHSEVLIKELLAISDTPQFNLIIRMWFEIVGLAARGQKPYAQYATAIANNWLNWIEGRLVNPQAGQAASVLAEIEGKLMLKIIGINIP